MNFGQGICSLDPDGTIKWTAGPDVVGPSFQDGSSPSVGADGSVYVSAGALYALSPAGKLLWAAGSNFVGAVVIGLGGALYATSSTGKRLHAFSPAGNESWAALEGLPPFTYPSIPAAAVDAGGTVYYCISNRVWALDPQGQAQWSLAVTSSWTQFGLELAGVSPVIGPDGTLYAALADTLYAIATGTNGPANSSWPMERQNARNTGAVNKSLLKGPQKRADGNIQFQIYGQLGRAFMVESSPNLSTWTSLTSIVATTLPTDVADLTATNVPLRFYRASSPP